MILNDWPVLAAYVATASAGAADVLHWAEPILAVATVALVIVTAVLVWATLLVHRDEINKMGDHLADANDNMTDVALAEIDAHSHVRDRMRHVTRVRHLARKGVRK